MSALASDECPPRALVRSEPGGKHAMLRGLAHPLVAGTAFPLALHFRDAGILTVQVLVGAGQ